MDLLCVGDVQIPPDVRDSKGREVTWKGLVEEGSPPQVHRAELAVVDLDGAIMEVCRIEHRTRRRAHQGKTFINGACRRVINRQDGVGEIDARIPSGDRSVLGGKEEYAPSARSPARHLKRVRSSVEGNAGRRRGAGSSC